MGQEIPSTGGDKISNVVPTQWTQTTNCPEWVDYSSWKDGDGWIDGEQWVDGV